MDKIEIEITGRFEVRIYRIKYEGEELVLTQNEYQEGQGLAYFVHEGIPYGEMKIGCAIEHAMHALTCSLGPDEFDVLDRPGAVNNGRR